MDITYLRRDTRLRRAVVLLNTVFVMSAFSFL